MEIWEKMEKVELLPPPPPPRTVKLATPLMQDFLNYQPCKDKQF